MPITNFRAKLPPQVTHKPMKAGASGTRAAKIITPQTADITANTPLVDDRNPYWAKDEQTVVFQSNRTDLQGTTSGALYHIYRARPDGNGLQAITGPLASPVVGATTSQTEPAFNPGTSSIVYIETDTGGAVDLRELNLVTQTSNSILQNNPQGYTFTALNHPEYGYAVGGNVGVIFAGKRTSDASFHLFTVDTQKGIVTQVTTGPYDDRNPTLSPDPQKPVIAFDRGPAVGTGPRDIYVIGTNAAIQNAVKITNFSAGGKSSDNREPAWSTDKTDQPQPGGTPIIGGKQLIGFASTRYDTANDGNANAVNPNGSHDIYWLKVTIAADPNNNGVFTVTTPEDPTSNPAFKLPTSDNQHIYDDRHPTWPQFINTYSVIYHSDRTKYDPVADANGGNASGPAGQPNDIFASQLIDVDAPTLVRFDDVTGDILNIQPRIAAPGSTVKISVKLADFQTGIGSVFAQIKNPNSKYQSADGKEHKVFGTLALSSDGGNLDAPAPVEYEMQRIFVGDGSGGGTPYSYSDPRYIASVADFYAFSGGTAPPDPGWLPLKFVSRDPNTGISTYSADWRTDNFPSDYVVDIITYDNAVDPFRPSDKYNWKIYDNIWGFTTSTFQAAHNILFVSDNAAGQKFFGTRFGNTALTNVYNTFWGTESWMTDIDVSLFPTIWFPKTGGNGGTLHGIENALGVRSYGSITDITGFVFVNGGDLTYDPLTDDGTVSSDGESVPATQTYDMWRILSRGPVPDAVLSQYTPHFEEQPADTINGETAPRKVQVAPRCVIWHSPYTGNLFVGAGSLTDISVQAQLHNFLAAGGRLMVNGQDVGWALTLDGSATNAFYAQDLRAQYVDDQSPGATTIAQAGGFVPFILWVTANYTLSGPLNNVFSPVTIDPWRNPAKAFAINPGHRYPGGGPSITDYVGAGNRYLIAGPTIPQARDNASFGVAFPDEIRSVAGQTDERYQDGNGYLQHYADAGTGQRVIYCSGGLEGLIPDEFGLPSPPFPQNWHALQNRRSEVMHNAVCWMRTGTIFGKVLDTEAGQPLKNVLVRLTNKRDATGKQIISYTGLTREDGSFSINGVEADEYEVTAFKPGFVIQKRTGQQVHGGFRAEMSFKMSKAQPATITGKVTRLDGTTPVVGAIVSAKDNFDPTAPVLTGTTDINGIYTIDRVPSQTTYTLTVAATGYGESIPKSWLVQDANAANGLLQPATTYGDPKGKATDPYNFELKPTPGSVTGFVFAKNSNGSKSAPIANATVTATCGTVTATAITDANGAYSFNDNNSPPNGLDPGACVLVAVAPGYASNNPGLSVSVVSGTNTVAEDILLSTVAPGSISGLVTRSSDGAPLPGVLVQLKDTSGNVIASATTTTVTTDSSGYRYNYKIASVPAGVTYTVTASRSGFTPNPASRSAAVTTGEETKNVNFSMEPLHTFGASLSLVSAPYDYSGYDPVNDITGKGGLLDIPRSDATNGIFEFATWDLGHYVYYPVPPANTFHIGRGYFLGYKQNIPLSIQGTPADTTRPFNYPLNAGWNMIGDPFLFDIDFTKVHFVDSLTGKTLTYQEAVAAGAIGSALYSYVSGTYVLSFRLQPWVGDWLRAYRNVVMIIDPTTDGFGRSAKIAATSRAVLQGGTGWSVNVRVRVGETRDEDNHIGVSSRAAEGFDGFKTEKPPAFGKSYTYLTFNHPDWGARAGGYGVDVRSASTTSKTWEFTVQTTEVKEGATLSWPNVAAVPRNTTLTLTDEATGQSRDMRTTSSYAWSTGDTPSTRKFRIQMTPGTYDTLKVTGVTVRPGLGGRGPAVGIGFNLTQSANVDVRILSASGSQVRRVTGRTSRAAGLNELTWDGKNDQNVSVPSGAYMVEIRAQSSDGKSTVRQVAQFTVVR